MNCARRILFSLLTACAVSTGLLAADQPLSASTTAPTQEALTVDTPHRTAHGHTFVAPAGWSIQTHDSMLILSAPEPDSRIALIDVAGEKVDADAALAAAWALFDPQSKRTLQRASDRPSRGGWSQIRGYSYAPAAGAPQVIFARVARHAASWNVAILDMPEAVAQTRDAQIELLLGSLLPKGYVAESFAGKTAHLLDDARIESLRKFIEAARQQLDVPGVAVGIVQSGRVLMAEGFGVRALGKPQRVDADTLFLIASNTKALTTLLLAKLVDAGRFSWDTPVVEVNHKFKLGDAQTTSQVLMKHLVCACTGLPRQDMEWVFEGERLKPDSVLELLATQQPNGGLGEHYQYSNLMAGAAGYIAAELLHPSMETGAAYDRAMQELVFTPLGMEATTFDQHRARRGKHAAPHAQDFNGRTVASSLRLNQLSRVSRPDGGAWSNVNDMLRYVQMELAHGQLPDGSRYTSRAGLLARREPQVSRGKGLAYGMGLKIDHSEGTPMIHHGGNDFGFISDMLWLPEHQVGAVILINSEQGGTALRNVFRRRLLEVLFDGEAQAASRLKIFAEELRTSAAERRAGLSLPIPAAAARALAKTYRNAELGEIRVLRKGTDIGFDFGGWQSAMATRAGADGAFVFETISPAVAGYSFTVGTQDQRRTLTLRDAQREYVFVEEGSGR